MEQELHYCCLVCKEVSSFILIFLYWTVFHAITESSVCAVYLCSPVYWYRGTQSILLQQFRIFTPPHHWYNVPCSGNFHVHLMISLENYFSSPFFKCRINEYLVIMIFFYIIFWLLQVNKKCLEIFCIVISSWILFSIRDVFPAWQVAFIHFVFAWIEPEY